MGSVSPPIGFSRRRHRIYQRDGGGRHHQVQQWIRRQPAHEWAGRPWLSDGANDGERRASQCARPTCGITRTFMDGCRDHVERRQDSLRYGGRRLHRLGPSVDSSRAPGGTGRGRGSGGGRVAAASRGRRSTRIPPLSQQLFRRNEYGARLGPCRTRGRLRVPRHHRPQRSRAVRRRFVSRQDPGTARRDRSCECRSGRRDRSQRHRGRYSPGWQLGLHAGDSIVV